VRQIAQKKPEAVVILTSRVDEEGQNEANALKKELGGKSNIVAHQLDVTSDDSVKKVVNFVKEKYGGLDVLVNNAGYAISGSGFDEQIARTTSGVNYFGVKRVTAGLLPLIRQNGRVINVSSTAGQLGNSWSAALKKRLLKEDITIKEIDDLAEEFFQCVRNGTSDEQGFPHSTYKVSKALVNAYVRNQYRAAQSSNDARLKSIFWAALCPGWVQTRMAPKGTKTVDDGADTPVWLATTTDKLENGKFWIDRHQQDW